jgi:hypothetical protein
VRPNPGPEHIGAIIANHVTDRFERFVGLPLDLIDSPRPMPSSPEFERSQPREAVIRNIEAARRRPETPNRLCRHQGLLDRVHRTAHGTVSRGPEAVGGRSAAGAE